MLTPIRRVPLTKRTPTIHALNVPGVDLVVWWYGGLKKNTRAPTVPNVVVYLRELNAQGIPGHLLGREIPITYLGHLRIGSVWRDGICQYATGYVAETFDVDFTPGAWRFVSPESAYAAQEPSPISPVDYPLRYPRDRNWLLDFPLSDGRNLLVPCLEFLVRFYSFSTEISRILTVYPWDEVLDRLAGISDEPAKPGQLPVKLRRDVRNVDAVFVAAAMYDSYTQKVAKNIHSQVQAAFSGPAAYAFLRVAPWFRGPGKLKVGGRWINGEQTFLGLNLIGRNDPPGPPIERDRDNTNKTAAPPEGDDVKAAWSRAPRGELKRTPETVDLTVDTEPDYGSGSVDVEEPEFVILGEPRVVLDVWRERAKTSRKGAGSGEDPTAFASGEAYGSGKGVGFASIHAPAAMESRGVLRDMWDALLYLRRERPNMVRKVDWYTSSGEFHSRGEPELIALRPFDDNCVPAKSTDIRNWLYYDTARRVPRGVLVVRVFTCGKAVYIVEIQRRARKRVNDNGKLIDTEESFKGMAFVMDGRRQFEVWLEELLDTMRGVKGVLEKVVDACPGHAEVFKHTPAKDEHVPCEAAVLNALAKMGVGPC